MNLGKIIGWLSLAAVLALGAFFLVRLDLRRQEGDIVTLVPIATSSPNVATSTNPVVKQDDKKIIPPDELEVAALKIIGRPVKVSPETGVGRERALANLQTTIQLLKDDYTLELAWLDLAAYRKVIGDYAGAAEAWEFVTKLYPESFVAFHNLGGLYAMELKDYPKSEARFLRAIEIYPRHPGFYMELSTIYEYHYLAKQDQAEAILLRGIGAIPTNVELKIALGHYYERHNQLAKAIQYLEEALALRPQNSILAAEIESLKQRIQ